MDPHNATMLRGFLLRKLDAIRIWISMLQTPEPEAYRALSDPHAVSEMLDFILAKMGHGQVPIRGGELKPSAEDSKRFAKITRSVGRPRGVPRKELSEAE